MIRDLEIAEPKTNTDQKPEISISHKKGACMKNVVWLLSVLFVVAGQAEFARADSPIPEIPVRGMVTLVDLGAKKCIPCKMMAPILKSLEKEYKDRAAVVFIDVGQKTNRKYVERFKIRAIPTQIFFDRDGREVYRHVGFMNKKSIIEKLRELGAV